MKKIITILLTLSCLPSYASIVSCTSFGFHGGTNSQAGIKESIEADCVVMDSKTFKFKESLNLEIEGLGLGLRGAMIEELVLTCPSALSKNLTNSSFIGVKASASALIGGDVGIFTNKRGGVCILTGLNVAALGVGVSGAKLTFWK